MADDLGYSDLGAYGAKFIRTPNLDRLAAEGVRCTSYYACGNVCTPSRAGFLTGRHPVRMRLAVNDIYPGSAAGLPASETTLAETLKDAGYATALIGKWHLGEKPEHWPTRHGFDYFYGHIHANGWDPLALYEGERKIEEPTDQATLTKRYAEKTAGFIEEHAGAPFFIFLASTMPHLPLAASGEFMGKSAAGLYGDAIEELDAAVGRVMEAVAARGLDERTLVIFTSDNGPDTEGGTGPFRGRKGQIWEGAFRVPLIARWRGRIPEGRMSGATLSGLDWMPTLAGYAGAGLPKDREIDGVDIRAVLEQPENETEAMRERAVVLYRGPLAAAVRRGPWKLIALPFPELFHTYKPGVLFNLEADPGETVNQADRSPEIAAELAGLMERARSEVVPADAGAGEKLAASGAGRFLERVRRSRYFVWVKIGLAGVIGLAAGLFIGRRVWRRA